MIPNIVIRGELAQRLSPYAKVLYTYLKSVAEEDGECWQNQRCLAKETNMSTASVSRAKQELLKEKLITVNEGEAGRHIVGIVDIWHRNMAVFGPPEGGTGPTKAGTGGTSTPYMEEEPLKKNPPNDPPFQNIQDSWNWFAKEFGLATISELNDKRRKAIKARWRKLWPNIGTIYSNISTSPFLAGKETNWRVTFDFVWCRQDGGQKILEGFYNRKPAPGARRSDTSYNDVAKRDQERLGDNG